MLADELSSKHRIDAIVIAADLAKPGEVAKLLTTVKRRKLDIDTLINNAGINHAGKFEQISPEAHHDLIALNISTTTEMLARFLPDMAGRGHGRVLNVASTSSFLPVPFMATYAASKTYLLSLTESLSEEFHGRGVSFTALCPRCHRDSHDACDERNERQVCKNRRRHGA